MCAGGWWVHGSDIALVNTCFSMYLESFDTAAYFAVHHSHKQYQDRALTKCFRRIKLMKQGGVHVVYINSKF